MARMLAQIGAEVTSDRDPASSSRRVPVGRDRPYIRIAEIFGICEHDPA
jgi:hypothetical protein